VIEDGFAGLDRAEEGLDLVEQIAVENSGLLSCGVHVVFKNVPAGEDQIVEPGQREELLGERASVRLPRRTVPI
jgi:hypothetical protein